MSEEAQTPPDIWASSGAGRSAVGAAYPKTTLWDLIDPELAALAMVSLYGMQASSEIAQMVDACAEAERSQDTAFWQATLQEFEKAFLCDGDSDPGFGTAQDFPS